MKTYVTFAIAALVIVGSSLHASAATETFTRYLQKGDSGQDVLILQKYLNSSSDTLVTNTGNGAPGSETDYYGELTKQAVIKYQKKNELGNKYGFFTIYSGALDDKTRNFMNHELDGNTTLLWSTETPEQRDLNERYRLSSTNPSLPYIGAITPGTVTNGDTVTISGRNFSTSTPNTIRMTYNTVAATSTDGNTLSVKVESALQDMFEKEARGIKSENLPAVKEKIGAMPLFITVQNTNGVSNPYQIYIKIR